MNATTQLINQEADFQRLDKAITEKDIKRRMAGILKVKASREVYRNYYKHQEGLYEAEIAILKEGKARLTKKHLQKLN